MSTLIKLDNHIDEETFLIEFFGNFGRDIGSPMQKYTNNPMDVIEYVKFNDANKLPSFISTQPRRAFHSIYGIEKIHLDFDYYDKTYKNLIDPDDKHKADLVKRNIPVDEGLITESKKWKLRVKEPLDDAKRAELRQKIMEYRHTAMEKEVAYFSDWLKTQHYVPMTFITRKGFHIYIYLDMVYNVGEDKDIIKETYRCLVNLLIDSYKASTRRKVEYVDENVKKDVYRIMRVPTSTHEATGQKIVPVKIKMSKVADENGNMREKFEFIPDKYRHLTYYTQQGLKQKDIAEAYRQAKEKLHHREEKLKVVAEKIRQEENSGVVYPHELRPCFRDRTEMPNTIRLGALMELYFAFKAPDKTLKQIGDEMMEYFGGFPDFDFGKTRYQVDYFLDRGDYKKGFRPWGCDKLREHNWCLENDKCPIWVNRYKKKDGEK